MGSEGGIARRLTFGRQGGQKGKGAGRGRRDRLEEELDADSEKDETRKNDAGTFRPKGARHVEIVPHFTGRRGPSHPGGRPCAEHSCVVVRRRVARASGVRVFGRDGTICFDVKEGGADSCF